ncbi:hypothetical protein MJ561_04540 [Klebsiella pneumoniae]|nr:hypothetical protein MJ561_04540 [Klebsiella pneumoniae]
MFEVLWRGGGFVFALRVLPVIVFVADCRALLPGIMQLAACILGALRAVLKTSRTESLSATANIFVGQTSAAGASISPP